MHAIGFPMENVHIEVDSENRLFEEMVLYVLCVQNLNGLSFCPAPEHGFKKIT
jgi:hypothetical protein